jgi:L-malate glycosyltransferase
MSAPAPILYTHYGDNWIRGSERCLLDLLTHLDRSRFRPVLWTNNDSLVEAVAKLDVPVYLDDFNVLFGWRRPRLSVRSFRAQVRQGRALVRRFGVRLLHANSAAPTQWLVPVGRSEQIPVLTHLHAPYIARDRFTLGLHLATMAVGVTEGCVADLVADGMPRERTRTIYNAVDVAQWARGSEIELRQRLGIRAEDTVITRVGSLIHRKGVDILLRAFADIVRTRPWCHLLCVGEGPDKGALESLRDHLELTDRVHFIGSVPSSGPVFRDATDIAVSPARMEGFGLTVIEAGAASLPVVATNTTGMTEILEDGVSGLIVPVEDQNALRDALIRLIDDPALRRQLGTNLRRVVDQRFLVTHYVDAFQQTYDELIAGSPTPPVPVPWSSYRRWIARKAKLLPRANG